MASNLLKWKKKFPKFLSSYCNAAPNISLSKYRFVTINPTVPLKKLPRSDSDKRGINIVVQGHLFWVPTYHFVSTPALYLPVIMHQHCIVCLRFVRVMNNYFALSRLPRLLYYSVWGVMRLQATNTILLFMIHTDFIFLTRCWIALELPGWNKSFNSPT